MRRRRHRPCEPARGRGRAGPPRSPRADRCSPGWTGPPWVPTSDSLAGCGVVGPSSILRVVAFGAGGVRVRGAIPRRTAAGQRLLIADLLRERPVGDATGVVTVLVVVETFWILVLVRLADRIRLGAPAFALRLVLVGVLIG